MKKLTVLAVIISVSVGCKKETIKPTHASCTNCGFPPGGSSPIDTTYQHGYPPNW